MSSVWEDCRSTGSVCPFFLVPLPLRLPVVLTSTGLSYLTRELWGGIMIYFQRKNSVRPVKVSTLRKSPADLEQWRNDMKL